ncbi:caspase domain-containing protein [Gautieria morchelliformis]|nr:caspase domain-containing protein [Gautieria morchelliformis]
MPDQVEKRNLRVFALLIGIDDYKYVTPKLAGCKNDVESMEVFLRDTFKHPSIECRTDKQATRQEILDTFKEHFTNNTKIQKGDAMVFYFSGHGSRVDSPKGWETPDGKIETICPYDQAPSSLNPSSRGPRMRPVSGIPDHEISVLLRELAEKKGNNIIAIFDSCHGGGMGRELGSRDPETVRSIETPSLFPEDLDRDAWHMGQDRDVKIQSPFGFSYPFMSSHVLLSACQPTEKAKERDLTYKRNGTKQNRMRRGVFTSNLVTSLYNACSQPDIQTTYATLMGNLSSSESQHPVCEGTNKNRYLFSTDGPDPLLTFKLKSTKSGWYEADAGWIHGVVEGTQETQPTEFTVLPSRGTLVAQNVGWNSCELVFKDGHPFHIPNNGTASMSIGRSLNVYLGSGVPNVPDIRNRFTIVTQSSKAHVVVRPDAHQKSLHFQIVDIRVPEHSRLLKASSSPRALVPNLDKIAYFNFHLHRENHYRPLHEFIKLSLVPLKKIPGGTLTPIYDDAVRMNDNVVTLTEPERSYGLSLESMEGTFFEGFYAYLYCFSPRDCAITSVYVPRTADTPLPAGHLGQPAKIGIVGFGPEGGNPIEFFLHKGCEDTIFFKLFVSSSYVDMKMVEQRIDRSQHQNKGMRRQPVTNTDVWDAWTFPITTRPS